MTKELKLKACKLGAGVRWDLGGDKAMDALRQWMQVQQILPADISTNSQA